MAVTSIVKLRSEAVQFRGLFKHVVEYEAIYDPDSVNSNSVVYDTVTTPGVKVGDLVLLSIDSDPIQLVLHGHVNANDSTTIAIVNPTAGAINLASTNLHIIALRPYHGHP